MAVRSAVRGTLRLHARIRAGDVPEMCFGHNQLRAEKEYGPEVIEDKATKRKSKSKSDTHDTEAKRSSEGGNHPRQQRFRTDEEPTVFDKLHNALVGLGFQRSRATEAIKHISKQCLLTETPMDKLLRLALSVLVPPRASDRTRQS